MKTQINPVVGAVVVAVIALLVFWIGWRSAFGPKPGQEPPPAGVVGRPMPQLPTDPRGAGPLQRSAAPTAPQ